MTELWYAFQRFKRQIEPRADIWRGWLADFEGRGDAQVTDEPGKVYVRIDRGAGTTSGDVIKAWSRMRPVPGWPVFVGTTPFRDWEYTVLEVDQAAIGDIIAGEPILEHHHRTHEWGHPSGSDDVVYSKFMQLYDFSVWPHASGTNVDVMSGFYDPTGTVRFLPVGSVALGGYVPGYGSRFVSICLSPTGTFEVVPGTAKAFLQYSDIPPAPSEDHWRLAAVHLTQGDAAIVQTPTNQRIIDLRFAELGWPRASGAGAGHDPVTLGADLAANLLGLNNQQLLLESQPSGTFFAVDTGGDGKPDFRMLEAADVPDVHAHYPGTIDPGDLAAGGASDYQILRFNLATGWAPEGLAIDSVTRTVGAGKDHPTIQGGIDWFKGKVIVGSCKISVDAGTYDEALDFSDIFIAENGSLELEGDTRILAGLSYVDGASMNQAGLANGGSGTCVLSNSGNDITVATVAGSNPDFDADGWVNGDKVEIYDNTDTIAEYTIDSVSNNVITLTATAPGVGTNDGTAIRLLPNRRIERTSAGPCVWAKCDGVILDGFHLKTASGANCHGVLIQGPYSIELQNISVKAEDNGIYADNNGYVKLDGGAVSVWDSTLGIVATHSSVIKGQYVVGVGSTYNAYAGTFSIVHVMNAVLAKGTYGGYATNFAHMTANDAAAIENTTGWYAIYSSFIQAAGTDSLNKGNGTEYNPAPTPPGSAQGNHYAVIYAS